jgi:5-hydroxyisourate hydrolase-like protein (transthyretin family)
MIRNKLKKWNLQLFAEDPAPTDPPVDPPADPKPADPKPGDPEPTPEDKKYTDAEVDKIVEKKFAAWKEKHEKDLKDAKEEAAKLAKMNAEQKQQYELDKLKDENEKLKTDAMKVELGRTASSLLKEKDIDATQNMLDFVVGKDAETTKANIDKFVEIIQAQLKAAEVERATGKTPKKYGNPGGEMSEIDKRIAKYKI